MYRPFVGAVLGTGLLSSAMAHAAGTPCDPCWSNRQGCSSYFVRSCNETGTYAYYKSKSTTQWLSKCSDGTFYLNNDCKNTLTVGTTTYTNLCKVACAQMQVVNPIPSVVPEKR